MADSNALARGQFDESQHPQRGLTETKTRAVETVRQRNRQIADLEGRLAYLQGIL